MNPIAQRHLSARVYCHRRLKELARPASWHDWLAAAVWHEILTSIERFTPADFVSVAELDALLDLATTQAEMGLLAQGTLSRRQLTHIEPAVVAAAIAAASAEFRHCVLEAVPADLPALPYRRVLGGAELACIWAEFETARQRLATRTIYDANAWTPLTGAIQRLCGGAPIVNLASVASFGYELDPAWLGEMLCGDDTYWTDRNFGWYLYADGLGYPIVAGALY